MAYISSIVTDTFRYRLHLVSILFFFGILLYSTPNWKWDLHLSLKVSNSIKMNINFSSLLLSSSFFFRSTAYNGYCFNGECPTLDRQCEKIWGYGGISADQQCYDQFNTKGSINGHCGKDRNGDYKRCETE